MNNKFYVLFLTILLHSVDANAFDLDFKKLKDTVDQLKSQQSNSTSPVSQQSRNPSVKLDSTSGVSSYDPIQNYDVQDANAYCSKLINSNVVKQIIAYNKSNNNKPSSFPPHADWDALMGNQNQLGIYLWDSLKINEKSRNSFEPDNQISANVEILDKWLSACIAKNLDTDLYFFTGISKEKYLNEARKQGVIKETKKVNSDGTISSSFTEDSGKYVQHVIPFNVNGKDSFINERDIRRIHSDFLVFLAFAVIRDVDTFLSNSGKQYLAYMNDQTNNKIEITKKQEEEKSVSEKLTNDFMANPPENPIQETCWVLGGIQFDDNLSQSEKFNLQQGLSGKMLHFKKDGIAWSGRDMVKQLDCKYKADKLDGSLTCPSFQMRFKFVSMNRLKMRGTSASDKTTLFFTRTSDMCL